MKNIEDSRLKDGILALVMLLPVLILYCCHYLIAYSHPGMTGSGFLQLDQAFYMASAREYWDNGSFNLLYSNPSDPGLHSPAIYFQLPVFILGIVWKITGINPGLLLNLFGFISAWACFYLCIRFWRDYTNKWRFEEKSGLLLLIWGGGLLYLAGFTYSFIDKHNSNNPFLFDPTHGWWFLNWGRNMVLPLESFYHLLFIAMVRAVYKRQYYLCLTFAILLLLSHPFTGLMAMLIYLGWLSIELFYIKNSKIPLLNFILAILLLTAHLLYYLVYLPSFTEHAAVFRQWKLNWNLSPISALLAYLPLLLAALYVLFHKHSYNINLSFRHFLIVWIVVSFLLSFNNLFISGYQPLHFTRGYLYLALFITAFPWIREWMNKAREVNVLLRRVLVGLVILVMLSDNIAWFISSSQSELRGHDLQLTSEKQHILSYLSKYGTNKDLLISDDTRLAYFATVYSPVKSLYSHWANTPDALGKINQLNSFRIDGKRDSSWKQQRLYYLADLRRQQTQSLKDSLKVNFSLVDSCKAFLLYQQIKK